MEEKNDKQKQYDEESEKLFQELGISRAEWKSIPDPDIKSVIGNYVAKATSKKIGIPTGTDNASDASWLDKAGGWLKGFMGGTIKSFTPEGRREPGIAFNEADKGKGQATFMNTTINEDKVTDRQLADMRKKAENYIKYLKKK